MFSVGNFIGFTGIALPDILILSNLNDSTLAAACSINRYIYSLCLYDLLWQMRVERFYPLFIYEKEENESWKDFYRALLSLPSSNRFDLQKIISAQKFAILEYLLRKGYPLEDRDLLKLCQEGHKNIADELQQKGLTFNKVCGYFPRYGWKIGILRRGKIPNPK